jgi:hypothetical protein
MKADEEFPAATDKTAAPARPTGGGATRNEARDDDLRADGSTAEHGPGCRKKETPSTLFYSTPFSLQ